MDLLGSSLLTKKGLCPTGDVLKGKVVALYFSAHWCPPCRGFTPQLAEWYEKDLRAKGLEVVFVSSDRDEAAFAEYYESMPWVALPFDARDAKAELSKKFKVGGIPALIILDEAGKVITKDGRSAVSEDPTGADFPWTPKSIPELLGNEFAAADGMRGLDALDGKVVAIYFSAHWCPPCRGFTPQLVEQYKKIVAAGHPFEIVFASSDRDEEAFKEYFAEMPWLALPYADRARKEALSNRFGVRGIPSLVLLDTDRSVISTEGRGAVMGDVTDFPFHPKPVKDMAQSVDGINDTLSVCVLAEQEDAQAHARYEAALEPIAREYGNPGEDAEVIFFLAKSSANAVPVVRRKCSLNEGVARHAHPLEERDGTTGGWGCDGCDQTSGKRYNCADCDFDFCEECNGKARDAVEIRTRLVLLDIADNGAFYLPEEPITTEGIRAALAAYKAKKLERKQLS